MDEILISATLARWCDLSYASDPRERARDFNLTDFDVITSPKATPALAAVGTIGKYLIVAFRGTVLAQFGDPSERWLLTLAGMLFNIGGAIIDDSELSRKIEDNYGGRVHAGFANLVEEVWPALEASVKARIAGKQ